MGKPGKRIVVPESITLGNLHHMLQMAFNWGDCLLHEFDIDGERFAIPDPEFDWELVRSEKRIQLKTALGGMTSFKYIYDFGDHWEHRIKLEKKLLGAPKLSDRALCLGGPNAHHPKMSVARWATRISFLPSRTPTIPSANKCSSGTAIRSTQLISTTSP
nr:plasmid pRiA4b ORF-3 family protein [Ferribacterium limneticum]